MSDINPYERLGVNDSSSFDEIQEARNRLVKECTDAKEKEAIETAYDAILMDRLRLRQEGKIKVPDRIRFPERLVEPPPELTPTPAKQTPDWLRRFIDTPSRTDVLLPAALFAGTSLISLTAPALALAIGVCVSLYFLNRKEHKFGRAFLLTFVGLVIGVIVGLQIGNGLSESLRQIPLELDTFASFVTFVILWAVSSFLR